MSREWLALVDKGKRKLKFSPSPSFFIKLHPLAVTAPNHQASFTV